MRGALHARVGSEAVESDGLSSRSVRHLSKWLRSLWPAKVLSDVKSDLEAAS